MASMSEETSNELFSTLFRKGRNTYTLQTLLMLKGIRFLHHLLIFASQS